jgi:hypothetical protein
VSISYQFIVIKEYKVFVLGPEGLRVKGDDNSDVISKLLSHRLNLYSGKGWQLAKLVPTMTSEGSVVKLIVTLHREKIITKAN